MFLPGPAVTNGANVGACLIKVSDSIFVMTGGREDFSAKVYKVCYACFETYHQVLLKM